MVFYQYLHLWSYLHALAESIFILRIKYFLFLCLSNLYTSIWIALDTSLLGEVSWLVTCPDLWGVLISDVSWFEGLIWNKNMHILRYPITNIWKCLIWKPPIIMWSRVIVKPLNPQMRYYEFKVCSLFSLQDWRQWLWTLKNRTLPMLYVLHVCHWEQYMSSFFDSVDLFLH